MCDLVCRRETLKMPSPRAKVYTRTASLKANHWWRMVHFQTCRADVMNCIHSSHYISLKPNLLGCPQKAQKGTLRKFTCDLSSTDKAFLLWSILQALKLISLFLKCIFIPTSACVCALTHGRVRLQIDCKQQPILFMSPLANSLRFTKQPLSMFRA